MGESEVAAAIAAAVEETRALLRSDGADLRIVEVDPRAARLRVAVDLSQVECQDCVVPPEVLRTVIRSNLERSYPGELEILIDDPREGAPR
jgi:hypothetical protein